jgi:hypothetical protein
MELRNWNAGFSGLPSLTATTKMFKENVNVKQQTVIRARAAFTGRISARTQTHV